MDLGYAQRFEPTECVYCDAAVTADTDAPVPANAADTAWAELASEHNEDCEWIATRAHRVGMI